MAFENVYITPRVRASLTRVLHPRQHKRFWEIVTKLQQGRFDLPGLNVEKLYTRRAKVYSARMNIEMRVIFSVLDSSTGQQDLVIEDVDHHDEAYNRAERLQTFATIEKVDPLITLDNERIESPAAEDDSPEQSTLLFRVPHYVLSDPDKHVSFERSMDRYLKLSDEQEELLKKIDLAYLVQGAAGTGKTTLALFYALNIYECNPTDSIFLFTYHDELACVCRSYKVNLAGEDNQEEGGIKVFSYLDFCRQYLLPHLPTTGAQWISRAESIQILTRVFSAKSRWSRSLNAEDFYNLIYSIFKGRFVPGTDRLPSDREDYSRIFKDYGRIPEDMDELLEIFHQYERWLKRSRLCDEADLIRLSHENLKNKAILSTDHPIWIVIDEIQDFTELEWKSLMLFWENQCLHTGGPLSFPFISGDINQNISRSGFRWQELHSYIEGIFRKLHRPNSVVKVQLHSNYRNTREIYELGAFLRSLISEPAADLGVPPNHHGPKPLVVMGDIQDFITFAGGLQQSGNSMTPLVVLAEDEENLPQLRRLTADNESLFLLPLKSSKGMEFEDAIIFRPFSSLHKYSDSDIETARLLDLWYMAATRARRTLLLFVTEDDVEAFKRLVGVQFDRFFQLTRTSDKSSIEQLMDFYNEREQYLPNYNVIFLERKVAEDLWQEFRDAATTEHNDYRADQEPCADRANSYAEKCKNKALRLWQRCHDYGPLGKALFEIKQYAEALPYLLRAGFLEEAAFCMEEIEQFHDAAESYIKCGRPDDAARCYEYAREYGKAARIYAQRQKWTMAAESFASAGEMAQAADACERAGMHRSAADIYRSLSEWAKSAECYERAEDFETAANMYLKVKNKLKAAKCLEKSGKFIQSAQHFEALHQWTESAELYERASMYKKAAELHSKAGNLGESARLFEQAGETLAAARMYERARNWERAAALYLSAGRKDSAAVCLQESGRLDDAADLFIELNDHEGAARCFEKSGKLTLAAEQYTLAGKLNDAGYCYERDDQFEAAADAYINSENLPAAASMKHQAGQPLEAAKLYFLANQPTIALEIAKSERAAVGSKTTDLPGELLKWSRDTNRPAIEAEILEHNRKYLEAAKKFEQCLMHGRAASNFEKCSRFSEAARCYVEDKKLDEAVRCFKKNNQWRQAAQCLESLKQWDEARKLYERCNDYEGATRCRNALNWFG